MRLIIYRLLLSLAIVKDEESYMTNWVILTLLFKLYMIMEAPDEKEIQQIINLNLLLSKFFQIVPK